MDGHFIPDPEEASENRPLFGRTFSQMRATTGGLKGRWSPENTAFIDIAQLFLEN
jgi:hypothetical protein